MFNYKPLVTKLLITLYIKRYNKISCLFYPIEIYAKCQCNYLKHFFFLWMKLFLSCLMWTFLLLKVVHTLSQVMMVWSEIMLWKIKNVSFFFKLGFLTFGFWLIDGWSVCWKYLKYKCIFSHKWWNVSIRIV